MTTDLIQSFRNSLQGQLVLPSDSNYEEVRKVHNGMIDKRPAMIAQCSNVADVQACIAFAKENMILLCIRGGGHNAGGLGIADNALVIDLSCMKDIQVNKDANTVKVQGGVLLKELDAATHELGMCVPSGIFGSTGVSGLTLGGGLGHMTRQYGLSIDNLLEAELVLADGKLLRASAQENADLFWALRGGGGNFGVVVSFLFKLSPAHTVYGGPMLWELDAGEEMLRWYHKFITTAPDNINGFFTFLTVPPVDPFPEHLQLKKMCGVVWCYTGDIEKAEQVFKPIREAKTPALDFVGPLPLPALQTMFDPLYPPGLQWYWKADFVKDMPDEAIELHQQFAESLPTPLCTMHLYPVNGAASRVAKTDTPWNYRDANYGMVMVGITDNPVEKDTVINWARNYWSALHPYSSGGAYVNMMMEEGDERIRASYGENYERLQQIKQKYDPENLFKVNQNIKPKRAVAVGV